MKRNIIILIAALVWFMQGQSLEAQDIKLPLTPVGKVATAFFEAFNAKDEELMKEFTAQYRTESALKRIPLESRMVQHRQIKGMMQRLSPRKVTASSDQSLTVLVYSNALQAWFETSFVMSEIEPGKLENFGLKPSTAPEEGADEGFGEWSSLQELLENVVEQHDIPGLSMAVIENGKLADAAVAGIRQKGKEDKVKLDDRFHIGSITKSMTATLIGRLVQEGKLKPESTLKELFPEVKMLPVYEAVTIEQLLHHRAGIPAYLTVTETEEAQLLSLPGNPVEQRMAFAKRVLNEEPSSEPGTAFSYSNAGYALLGTIAEKLYGKAWAVLLEEIIFVPLSMHTAGTNWPRSKARPNEPAGHFNAPDARVQRIDEYELGAYIEPAGDVHASMQDLARYALAHMNGVNGKSGILNADTFQWLHSPKPGQNYAAGWLVSKPDDVTVHEHSGSAGTFLAIMMIEPENNRGWVIAANTGSMALDGIFRKVIEAWKNR